MTTRAPDASSPQGGRHDRHDRGGDGRFRGVTARKEHTCSAALTHGPHPIHAGERYVRVTIFRSLLHESGIGTVKFCAEVGAERPDIPDDPLTATIKETTT